ncbi:MAG: hypothetical protein RL427_926 [Bacteroidota bacterium]
MKKYFVLLVLITWGVTSCSSDSKNNVLSSIMISNVPFVPAKATLTNETSSYVGQGAVRFTLEKGGVASADYECITFKVNYPLVSSSAPNGVYDFGPAVIGETLLAGGEYRKNNSSFSMVGYTVKVTAMGGKRYKLEFQNVQAINLANEEVVLTGSYEGDFVVE